jgi:hypothetical protein
MAFVFQKRFIIKLMQSFVSLKVFQQPFANFVAHQACPGTGQLKGNPVGTKLCATTVGAPIIKLEISMIVMFTVGILLAGLSGFFGGIVYARWERSVYTKKFKEKLEMITRDEQERIETLQKLDQVHLDNVRKEVENILASTALAVPTPPREEFN